MFESNKTTYVYVGLLSKSCRLDDILVSIYPEYARVYIKKAIILGRIKVNEQLVLAPKKRLAGLDLIEVSSIYKRIFCIYPQRIPLEFIYEDDYIIALNKTSGVILQPGFGNNEYTILNGILYYYSPAIKTPRFGIVHRLDKETTGLLTIAKSIYTYSNLVEKLHLKKIIREYEGVVYGSLWVSGKIVKPIAHNVKRNCMKAGFRGKASITNYFAIERFLFHTRLRFVLETGRTHQIRVHMTYVKHPFVGDKKYGKPHIDKTLKEPNRQSLHAFKLGLLHPVSFVNMKLNSPLSYDILSFLNRLRLVS